MHHDAPLPGRWTVFAVASIGLLLVGVDQTILATALSTLQHDLDTSVPLVGWTITVYALGQMVTMPIAGKLSDLYGPRRVFLAAAAVFGVASLLCAMAPSVYALIVFRTLQSIGGGCFMPAASGIMSEQFGRDRGKAIGLFTSVYPIGGVLGPVAGGYIVEYASWRVIFLANVPFCLLLIVLGALVFPAGRRRTGVRMDGWGAVTLAAALLGVMTAITTFGEGAPAHSWQVVGPGAAGLVGLVLFTRRARRTPEPLVPLDLITGRHFRTVNVVNLVFGCAAIGFTAMLPFYAALRYGIEPLRAGSLLIARAIGMTLVSTLTAFALSRTGNRVPMLVGFTVMASGFGAMALPPPGMSGYWWLALSTCVAGLGIGMAAPAANNATLEHAQGQIAAVSGLRGMFRQAGAIVSIAVVTSVLARTGNSATAFASLFLALAVVILLLLPLIRGVKGEAAARDGAGRAATPTGRAD
ncbi:MFS transporter [Streptomyces sp. NPDC052077]|uniref:MFS transporter n=1 Tax=Streptomyces sp. NPDC052077 TaxID=3154757 RepID=UPI0034384E10